MKRSRDLNMAHLRTGAQTALMERAARKGECPFCERSLAAFHKKPIVRRGKHWLVTENMFPYKGSRHHLLVISRVHVVRPSQIPPAAWSEFARHIAWVEKSRRIPGGSLLMRFGDTEYSGASIAHLHAHIVSGGRRGPRKKSIESRLAYSA